MKHFLMGVLDKNYQEMNTPKNRMVIPFESVKIRTGDFDCRILVFTTKEFNFHSLSKDGNPIAIGGYILFGHKNMIGSLLRNPHTMCAGDKVNMEFEITFHSENDILDYIWN